jgi:protein O-GlcNAc transferase
VLASLPVVAVTVVDVGASSLGNEAEPYAPLVQRKRARVTGFEPDAQALAVLQQQRQAQVVANGVNNGVNNGTGQSTPTHTYLPHFVGNGQAATFFETEWSLTGSLFEPSRPVLDSYHHLGRLVLEKARHAVNTVRLDDVLPAGSMDMLKIDVQGAECLVFDGAAKRLNECLLVWTEVEFVPLYKNQPLFADVDARLRQSGLQFLCFAGIAPRTLASWPAAGVQQPQRPQQLWADALYIPSPDRLASMGADANARLALLAHHVAASFDVCHAALQRFDAQTGSNFAPRYLQSMQTA